MMDWPRFCQRNRNRKPTFERNQETSTDILERRKSKAITKSRSGSKTTWQQVEFTPVGKRMGMLFSKGCSLGQRTLTWRKAETKDSTAKERHQVLMLKLTFRWQDRKRAYLPCPCVSSLSAILGYLRPTRETRENKRVSKGFVYW